jgi:hypothetical protein
MNTRKMLAGLSLIPLAGVIALAGPVGAAAADKAGGLPGNNGTVKIDGREFDEHPDNQPHVGCDFEVDFYDYDEGDDIVATVTFTVQPPTGKGEEIFSQQGIDIGGDDNSGGGSAAGIDANVPVDLNDELAGPDSGYTPHPKQGYHVKLTVNAKGSQGADTKHKVFWVEGCAPETSSNPNSNASANPNSDTAVSPAAQGTEAGVDVMGNSLTQPAAAAPGTSVQGANVAGSAPAALARTGSPIGTGLLLAALALGLGTVARHFGRTKTVTSIG